MIRVKAQFDNADTRLWPGQYVNTRLTVATLKDALVVPQNAIITNTKGTFVYTVAADQTAVDALHDFGIDVPVSCEQGLCGTCVVPAEGEGAEHRDFCLTSAERQHKVALCCSRAREQELVIHL